MRTRLVGTTAAVVLLAATSGTASAQPRVPVVNRPTFSPYLNLLSGYGSPAFNYYALVRPQLDVMQQQAQIQQQLAQQAQALQATNSTLANGLIDPRLPVTGRGATFGYYSHYYPTLGGGRGAVYGGDATTYGGYSSGPIIPAYAANRNQQIGQAPRPAARGAGGAGGVQK